METTPTTQTSGMSGMTIGIIVIVIVVLLGIGYFVYSKTQTMPAVASGGGASGGAGGANTGGGGNDYVSGAAINKRQLSNYAAYVENPSNYGAFWSAVANYAGISNPPTDPDGTWNSATAKAAKAKADSAIGAVEQYIRGFLKGMNLAMRPDYVAIFKPYIDEYMNNAAKMPHWEVKTGEFLK